jgi:hypothetical protein
MLHVPNVAAQLMAGPLLGRGILCFKGRIRGDVLRHVFGPDDFLRKQIKAERGKKQGGGKTQDHIREQGANQTKTHSRIVRFFGMLPSWGCLPLSMALRFFPLRTGKEMRNDG